MTISEAFNIIENEIWKQYPLDNKYYISSYGRVKSLHLEKSGKSPFKKQKLNKYGYYELNINHRVKKRVHMLVAITFLNHTPQGMKGLIINHINGIKTDNRVENLELVTNRYNVSYAKEAYTNKQVGVMKSKYGYYSQICKDKKSIHLITNRDKNICKLFYDTAYEIINEFNGNKKEFRDKIKNILKEKYNITVEKQSRIESRHTKSKGNSEYIGVSYHKRDKLYSTSIKIKGTPIHIISSKNEILCSKHYQIALNISNEFDGDKKTFVNKVKEIYNNSEKQVYCKNNTSE